MDTQSEVGAARPVVPSIGEGTRVGSRYRIVGLLGSGAMASVYEAEDLLVGGRLALKVLDRDAARTPHAVERLRREIGLARRVTHPNVCRVYDLGEHDGRLFLTMELLVGETLAARIARGALPRAEVKSIASELLHGLDALHAAGVIHRDIKPSNVLLVDGGRAVLTDFGLARSISPDDERLTGDAGLLGTPAYMSPEQVEGREATPASDLYAFGVVLFEMSTGVLPFHESTVMGTATARLLHDPPRPRSLNADIDRAWEAVILRCLARDPSDRFDSVADVTAALDGRPGVSRRSVLVVGGVSAAALVARSWDLLHVFHAPSPDIGPLALIVRPDDGRPLLDDARAVAVWLDLYDALSSTRDLVVLAPDTTLLLAAGPDPVGDARGTAGGALRIVIAGERELTLTTELVNDAGEVTWRARHARPPTEAPRLVADCAAAIAQVLGHAAPAAPVDLVALAPEVYVRYGAALARSRRGDPDALGEVAAAAPGLIRARAHHAEAVAWTYMGRASSGLAVAERALRIADEVLARDPAAVRAHVARSIAAEARWDWATAEAASVRAYQLAPRHAAVLGQRSDLLMVCGRFDEAIALAAQGAALDPLSPHAQRWLGWCLVMGRRFSEGIAQYQRAIAMEPDGSARAMLLGFIAVAQAELTQFDDAVATADQVRALGPSDYTLAQIATVYASAGRRDTAVALLHQIRGTDVDRFMLAWVHAALGETDTALPLLEQLVAEHDVHALMLRMTFLPQPLRAHPRFAALIDRIGFP